MGVERPAVGLDEMVEHWTVLDEEKDLVAGKPGKRGATRLGFALLAHVNTLMLQDVLAVDTWAGLLSRVDRRGLTPLFWTRVRPHGEVRLDPGTRLAIGATTRHRA